MTASTAPNVTVGPGVQDFLRKNGAEASFQAICDILRECFPQMYSIDARLEEDYDEPGWLRVVVIVMLRAPIPTDLWLAQHKRYHERRAEQLAPPQSALFVTRYESPPE